MKKIAVIAYSLKTSVFYADQLRGLFGSGVEVASYALEKGIAAPIQADVALISAHSIYGYVEEKLAQCQRYIKRRWTSCGRCPEAVEPCWSTPPWRWRWRPFG